MKLLGVFLLSWIAVAATAQLRYTKLVLESKQVFSFGVSDILVADTLIMGDSSRLVLNNSKAENYLHAKVLIVGRGCSIDGNAMPGTTGRSGKPGASFNAPCKAGADGEPGASGTPGNKGVDLLVYIKTVDINSALKVSINGGRGGHGGIGGDGGGGGSGTVHCKGGNGGKGGRGGDGGNGGNGGALKINGPLLVKLMLEGKIVLQSRGGQFGNGGSGGVSGYGGLGPSGKYGSNGPQGEDGTDGSLGVNGSLSFVETQ
jgi:hypothetical protein